MKSHKLEANLCKSDDFLLISLYRYLYSFDKRLYPECKKNPQSSIIRRKSTKLKNRWLIWADTSPKKIYGWQISI